MEGCLGSSREGSEKEIIYIYLSFVIFFQPTLQVILKFFTRVRPLFL